MKLKLFYTIIVCTIATMMLIVSNKSNKIAMYDIALENIEAMASPEGPGGGSGETGVTITKCSKNPETYYEGNYCYKCNSSTTSTLIFKCPSSLSKGKINDFDYYYCIK